MIFDTQKAVRTAFDFILDNKKSLSPFLRDLFKRVSAEKNPTSPDALGYTIFQGLGRAPEIFVSEDGILGSLKEAGIVADEMRKKMDTMRDANWQSAISSLDGMEKMYIGILSHEIAHLFADNALFPLVQMISTDDTNPVNRARIKKIKEAQKEGKQDAKFTPEELADLKEQVTNFIDNIKTFKLSDREREELKTYLNLAVSDVSFRQLRQLQSLHNIFIDVFIENALPTVIPASNDINHPMHNWRELARESLNYTRSIIAPKNILAILGDNKDIKLGSEELEKLMKSKSVNKENAASGKRVENALNAKEDSNLLNSSLIILQPYIDPRYSLGSFDIKEFFKDTLLGEVLEAEVKDVELYHHPDLKTITGYDILDELRAINQANYDISLDMTAKSAHLSEDEKEKLGVGASYFTKVFNIFIDQVKEKFMAINDMVNEAKKLENKALNQVKDLLNKAAKAEKDANIKQELQDIADSLPDRCNRPASQLGKELKGLEDQSKDNKVKDLIKEARAILKELEYELDYNNMANPNDPNAYQPSLPPDKVTGTPPKNQPSSPSQGQGQSGDQQQEQNNDGEQNNQDQDGQKQDGQQQDQQGQDQNGQGQSGEQQQNNKQQQQGSSKDAGQSKESDGQSSEKVKEPSADQNGGGSNDQDMSDQSNGSDQGKEDQEQDSKGSKGGKEGEEREQAGKEGDSQSNSGKENGQEQSDSKGNQNGKTLGERMKEAMEKANQISDGGKESLEDVCNDLKEHNTFNDKDVEEKLKEQANKMKEEVDKKLDEVSKDVSEEISKSGVNVDANQIKDIEKNIQLDEQKKKDMVNRYNDGKDYINKPTFYKETETDKYLERIFEPQLKGMIEEIKKNMQPSKGRKTQFDQGTYKSVGEAALKTRLSGKIKTNAKMEKQNFTTNINFVIDTSGSMDANFTYKNDRGQEIQISYIEFAKSVMRTTARFLSLFGVGINVYTFDDHPAMKSFSTTFVQNPMDDVKKAKIEKESKLKELDAYVLAQRTCGGTWQIDATLASIMNTVDEYILSGKDLSALPKERQELIKMNGKKMPSPATIMITDDNIRDFEKNKADILCSMLNQKDGPRNLFCIRMANDCFSDLNNWYRGESRKFDRTKEPPISQVFQGFPVNDEWGTHGVMVCKTPHFSVSENLSIAAKGVCETIKSVVYHDLIMCGANVQLEKIKKELEKIKGIGE